MRFSDELGEDLAKKMLGVWYFWQERFQQMVLTDRLGDWFDDTTTAGMVEEKQEILIRAALDAQADLSASLGNNSDQIGAFMDGEKVYWWFSDREIANHTRLVLMLTPTAVPSN